MRRRRSARRSALLLARNRSTNDVAAGYAERGAPQGTTVLAAAQTSGRGRLGRHWYSPPGAGLYFSIVIRSRAAAPFLTLAGGVAVAEGIRAATGLPLEIKWPNDVVTPARPDRRGGGSSPAFWPRPRRRPTGCSTSSSASASTSARRRTRRNSPIAPRRSRPSSGGRWISRRAGRSAGGAVR